MGDLGRNRQHPGARCYRHRSGPEDARCGDAPRRSAGHSHGAVRRRLHGARVPDSRRGPTAVGSSMRWDDGGLHFGIRVKANAFSRTSGDDGEIEGAFVGAGDEGMIGTLTCDDLSEGFGGVREQAARRGHRAPQGVSALPCPRNAGAGARRATASAFRAYPAIGTYAPAGVSFRFRACCICATPPMHRRRWGDLWHCLGTERDFPGQRPCGFRADHRCPDAARELRHAQAAAQASDPLPPPFRLYRRRCRPRQANGRPRSPVLPESDLEMDSMPPWSGCLRRCTTGTLLVSLPPLSLPQGLPHVHRLTD